MDCGYLLSAHDGENADLSWFGALKGPSALIYRRSSGENVVDEDEISPGNLFGISPQLEGFSEVFSPFFTREGRLPRGGSNPFESKVAVESKLGRERASDSLCLIEAAFS